MSGPRRRHATDRPNKSLDLNPTPISHYPLNLLEFQLDFQAVPAEEGHRIGHQPLLHISIAVELWLSPVAVLDVGRSVRIWVVLVLLLVFTCFIVADLDLHVEGLQVVEVGVPALLQELEVLLFSVEFVRLVEPRQVLHLELSCVELCFVGIGCEICAIGELVALPEHCGRPNLAVAQDNGKGLADHLILGQRLVGHTLARVHFVGIRYL